MRSHRTLRTASAALAVAALPVVATGAALAGGGPASATKAPQRAGRSVAALRSSPRAASCSGSIELMAPLTGSVAVIGQQQLHWGEYAATIFNRQHHTHFGVIQGDTEFQPAQATIVAQQAVSNSSVLAVVGPSSSANVEAVGPIMASAHMAFISASATSDNLFSGKYPTFFSVVAKNGQEGPYDAGFIVKTLHARHVAVIDDESAYSVELANLAQKVFKVAHVSYVRLSVNQQEIDYAAVIAKIPSDVTAVYLPWQVAGNAQLFAEQLAQAHRKVTIVGSDGVSSPTEFHANGDYVTSFSPDLTQSSADASLVRTYLRTYHGAVGTYGPPEFVAVMVALTGIEAACRTGHPTRAAVLAAIRRTDLPTSLLGTPIRFNRYGLLTTARFYMFKVVRGNYVEVS